MAGIKEPIYLMDVNYFIYSGHHATHLTSRSKPIGGAYTTLKNLLKLSKLGTNIVACLDSEYSFKKERVSSYKAHRVHKPEIQYQREVVTTFLHAMNIPIAREYGYEADDIMATLSSHYKAVGRLNFIVAVDKDLMACVGGTTRMLNLQTGTMLDEEGVKAKLGVYPNRVEDFLALVGDSADGFKGIPGVGPVAAVKILRSISSLNEVLENPELLPPGTRKKLMTNTALDSFRESIALSVLERDVPNLEKFHDPKPMHIDKEKFNELCTYHGFKSLILK